MPQKPSLFRFAAGALVGAAFLLPPHASAQETELKTAAHASYRPRLEVDHRFTANTLVFVTHRARLDLTAEYGDWLVFVQPQDVRTWGSEVNTAAQGNRVDLHQGFAQYTAAPEFKLRVGRQEIAYLNHRIIGSLDWAQPARSFDAVRVGGDIEKVHWDAFLAPLANAAPRVDDQGNALPPADAPADTGNREGGVASAVLSYSNAGRTVAALGVYDWNRDARRYRRTVGLHTAGRIIGDASFLLEGYYQDTNAAGTDTEAYLYAGELGYNFSSLPVKPGLSVGYTAISGNTENYGTFDTLFATNHKFYGYMDVFLALPAHTGGRGLRDAFVNASATVGPTANTVTFHRFLAGPGNEGAFGNELDVISTWKINKHVSWQNGVGVFFTEGLYPTVRPGAAAAPEMPYWAYSMLMTSL